MTVGEQPPKDPYQKYKDFKWEKPDELRNGPIDDESRKCRDCICCIIFILLFILCLVVAGFGFYNGKPTQLFYLYDENGKACGHDEGYEEYPYLYFTNVISGLTELNSDKVMKGVCVKECPKEKLDTHDIPFYDLKNKYYTELECKIPEGETSSNYCHVSYLDYYESKVLIERICFPKSNDEIEFDENTQVKVKIYDPNSGETFYKVIDKSDTYTDAANPEKLYILVDKIKPDGDAQDSSANLINISYFTQLFTLWINDLNVTKWAIAGSIGWSFLLAMFYFLFLRCCAGFITFLLILFVQAGLIVLAVYFKFLANDEEQQEAEGETTNNAFFWLFVALSAAWFLFILIMCNRIRLAVALTEITSKYIHQTWCIVFAPFLFFFIILIWCAYWIVLLVFLYTSGEFDTKSKIYASYKMDGKLEYGFWFHIVMLFYITAVISAYSQFVYASSACIWYFNAEKGTENHPIAKSFYRGFRYHFGSLVFGATIVAIIRFLMFFVEYIKKKSRKDYR